MAVIRPMPPLTPPVGRVSGLPAPTKTADTTEAPSRFGLLRGILDKLNQGDKADES